MKKVVKILGLSVAAIMAVTSLSFAAATSTSFGQKAINVKQAKGKITIDAKAKEASWKKAPNLAKNIKNYKVTESGEWKKGATTPHKTKVKTWKMLWDKGYIYVFMEVTDSTVNTSFTANANSDCVEYHLDATNCKKASYQRKCDAQYRLSRDGKVSGWGADGENTHSDTTFKSNAKSKSTNKGYTQEVKINIKKHGVKKLTKGKKLGFDLQINDAVAFSSTRDYQLVWNAKDIAWTDPSAMGTIKLVK